MHSPKKLLYKEASKEPQLLPHQKFSSGKSIQSSSKVEDGDDGTFGYEATES